MVATRIATLLATAERRLTGSSATPRLDAEVLLAHTLNRPRSYLHAWPERVPGAESTQRFAALLRRRLAGEPVAYLVGRREFWSLDLMVTPATLIPRPETELLVELALAQIPPHRPLPIVDLGTGSGAIALAIARERPKARIVATDISSAALAVARHNARQLGIDNVEFRQGDWCAALKAERFSLLVVNPPYLASKDPHLGWGDLRFEPRAALVAGPDGLDAIRAIITQASDYLHPGDLLLLEHGYDQGASVPALLQAGHFTAIATYPDAAGISRVSGGRRPAD